MNRKKTRRNRTKAPLVINLVGSTGQFSTKMSVKKNLRKGLKKMHGQQYGVNLKSDMEDELPFGEDAFSIMDDLKDWSEKLGPESDVQDVIEELNQVTKRAELKQTELEILSYLSLHSNDPSIVDLRKKLFLQAKMIHEEELKKLLDLAIENMEYDRNMPVETSSDVMRQVRTSPGLIVDNIFSWIRRNTRIRKFVRKVR